jgi:hypothetical protein
VRALLIAGVLVPSLAGADASIGALSSPSAQRAARRPAGEDPHRAACEFLARLGAAIASADDDFLEANVALPLSFDELAFDDDGIACPGAAGGPIFTARRRFVRHESLRTVGELIRRSDELRVPYEFLAACRAAQTLDDLKIGIRASSGRAVDWTAGPPAFALVDGGVRVTMLVRPGSAGEHYRTLVLAPRGRGFALVGATVDLLRFGR